MRLTKPRLEPLPEDQWSDEVRQILKPMIEQGRVFNIFKTLAHHPNLMRRWLVFGNHVLFKSTLPARERELVILRIGYLCQANYEWTQHVQIGLQAGLTTEEIRRIAKGPDAPEWKEQERLLLKATDELRTDAFISDATWAGLQKYYNTQQLMDLVFAVGQYNLVSMALNTLGVQLDPSLPRELSLENI
jgi:alkylhydroperoxidase family enzyme